MKNFYLVLSFIAFALCAVPHVATAQTPPQNPMMLPIFRPIQTSPDDLNLIDVGIVEEVVKADIIRLKNGKRYILDNVRLSGFDIPIIKEYLEKMLLGKQVGIYINDRIRENRTDENGNRPAHVQTEDGVWVQGDLVSKGYAWATSTAKGRDMVMLLYKKEIAARAARVGLWSQSMNNIKTGDEIAKRNNAFIVYEGVVKRVIDNKDDVNFYFSDDGDKLYRVLLKTENRALFRLTTSPLQFVNFESFKNVRIRIRGFVTKEKNGAYIELTHPEQLEFPDFEKYNRELLMQTPQRPPVMPYDIKTIKK